MSFDAPRHYFCVRRGAPSARQRRDQRGCLHQAAHAHVSSFSKKCACKPPGVRSLRGRETAAPGLEVQLAQARLFISSTKEPVRHWRAPTRPKGLPIRGAASLRSRVNPSRLDAPALSCTPFSTTQARLSAAQAPSDRPHAEEQGRRSPRLTIALAGAADACITRCINISLMRCHRAGAGVTSSRFGRIPARCPGVVVTLSRPPAPPRRCCARCRLPAQARRRAARAWRSARSWPAAQTSQQVAPPPGSPKSGWTSGATRRARCLEVNSSAALTRLRANGCFCASGYSSRAGCTRSTPACHTGPVPPFQRPSNSRGISVNGRTAGGVLARAMWRPANLA